MLKSRSCDDNFRLSICPSCMYLMADFEMFWFIVFIWLQIPHWLWDVIFFYNFLISPTSISTISLQAIIAHLPSTVTLVFSTIFAQWPQTLHADHYCTGNVVFFTFFRLSSCATASITKNRQLVVYESLNHYTPEYHEIEKPLLYLWQSLAMSFHFDSIRKWKTKQHFFPQPKFLSWACLAWLKEQLVNILPWWKLKLEWCLVSTTQKTVK